MKYLKKFNESVKEKISLNEFLETITKTKFFIEEEVEDWYSNNEWPNNFISNDLLTDDFNEMYSDSPYIMINVYVEKGDGKDEETVTGIFKRKSDGKCFKLWCHDAGFIGPETLSCPDYLEEI